jgi:hypothetical protein
VSRQRLLAAAGKAFRRARQPRSIDGAHFRNASFDVTNFVVKS